MDLIIKAREFGKRGADKRAENQVVTSPTLEGSLEDSPSDTLSTKVIKESKVIKLNNKSLLSETNRDSLDDVTKQYFDIAIGFQKRFVLNKKRLGLTNFKDQDSATFKSYVDPIRLAFEVDKRTRDDFASVFSFLAEDEFWMKNVMSTSSLRKNMDKLLLKSAVFNKFVELPTDWFHRELTKEQENMLTNEQKAMWKKNKTVLAIEGGYLRPIKK